MDHTKVAELCSAAFAGNVGAVQSLLSQGVPVGSRDDTGMTPLHRASITGKVPVVSLLLSQGASPKERDIVCCTAALARAFCTLCPRPPPPSSAASPLYLLLP
jgi:hypothetical protein